jgi:hypothetical protein
VSGLLGVHNADDADGACDDPNRVPIGDSEKPQACYLNFFRVWLIINGFADLTRGLSPVFLCDNTRTRLSNRDFPALPDKSGSHR